MFGTAALERFDTGLAFVLTLPCRGFIARDVMEEGVLESVLLGT